MERGNILADMPDARRGEVIETLAAMTGRTVRIERIVSGGHAGPEGFWYDQDGDEWVVVLRGEAVVAFRNGDGESISEEILREGDWLLIPAHEEHRVASTCRETLWLAVHAGG